MQKINKKKVLILVIFIIISILLIFMGVKITHKNNDTKEVGSNNKIEDTEAPQIELNGKENLILINGKEYKEEKATATDNIDGDITDKIQIEGNIDTNKNGDYEIKYIVQDNAGNKTEVVRKVKVCSKLSDLGLPVLMYHFFYDKNTGKGKDNNWIEISEFEKQIKYLSDNNYYFPTWEEVENYIDKKQDLPEKSIVITVDDGDASFFELAVPVLNKYNIDATSFVITEWYGWRVNEQRSNVIYESHTNSMHESGANGKGRMLSWSYNDIVKDLKTSQEILGGADIFCYPFGQYNETDIKALKETGFKLAFTTQEGRVKPGSKKYELPRVRISRNTEMEYFKELVK